MNKKFQDRVNRLADKISQSKTPVPGLIMGLSGTDSVVAFLLCYEALKVHNLHHRLKGMHFIWDEDAKEGWFELLIVPWLHERCPEADIIVGCTFNGENEEEGRWGTLHHKANIQNYWPVATVNCTEMRLGTYSNMAMSASLWPLATLWKTDILQICKDFNAPEILMHKARIPDCACGRDELAAENIELIDEIIQFKVDATQHDPVLLKKLTSWVRDTQDQYGYKQRIPYII